MGEYADYMLNGDDCQHCGKHLGAGDGFPRSCAACAENDEEGDPAEDPAYLAQVKKESAALTKKFMDILQKHFDAKFSPDIGAEFSSQISGVVRGLYVNGHGQVCHKGLLKTVENNRKAQQKAVAKKQRKAEKYAAKSSTTGA